MSRIDRMIHELAPRGVQYSRVDEVAVLKRGTAITKKCVIDGPIPVVAGGRTPAYFHNESNRVGETVAVAASGAYAGFVSYWDKPVFVSDAFTVAPKDDRVNSRYLYFWLQSQQELLHSFKSGGGVPHVYPRSVAGMRIPVPPLEVQLEIVRVLDKFTQLEAELEAELEARRAQYEHYRHELLAFSDYQSYVAIARLVHSVSSGRNKSRVEGGAYPVYGSTGPIGSTDQPVYSYNALLVARVGANAGRVNAVGGKYDVSDNTLIVSPNGEWDLRFAYHQLTHMHLNRYAVGGGQPLVTGRLLKSLEVAVPPLDEQRRIASVLDRFDVLVNDISIGLPAELVARRKQYEYYRDRLLTFKETV